MGLFASLRTALFGAGNASTGHQQPGELTAVAPDFSGIVSNRPAGSTTDLEAATSGVDCAAGGGHDRPANLAPVAGEEAQREPPNEFTAVAPDFSGVVTNRPPESG